MLSDEVCGGTGHRCGDRRCDPLSHRQRSTRLRLRRRLCRKWLRRAFTRQLPGKYTLFSGLLAEIVLTMMFLFIIMGLTHAKAPVGLRLW